MGAVRNFVELIGNVGRALGAMVSSNKRRRYTATGLIAAPQSSVWRIASLSMMYNARDEATGTMRKAERRDDGSGIIDITVQAEGETARVAYRVVDDRPPDGQVVEILPEGQNIFNFCGRDYFLAYTLRPAGDKTELTIAHELTHTSASGYLIAPFLPSSGLRLTRRKAEDDAGTTQYHRNFAGAALVTGVLTLASFIPWLGLGGAPMLVALIFIHELGHVAAMRSVGLPVRGLYFVPFLGGVAVGAAARTEAERGFVSIMGPG